MARSADGGKAGLCNLVSTMSTVAREATNQDLKKLRVAVLGAGKMGGILLQAFLKQQMLGPEQLTATVAHEERAAALSTQWGVQVTTDNVAAVRAADVVLLGVKPFQVPALMEEIRPALAANK